MKLKIKLLPAIFLAAVLLAGCSKTANAAGTASAALTAADTSSTEDTSDTSYEDDADSEEEIWSITGYYLRTDHDNMLIAEHSFTSQSGSTEIYYEPTVIYFEGDEQGDVTMDSLKTGDKIEADVKLIMETYPAQAPIYGLRFIESGDISNIGSDLLLNLESMGYHAVIGEKTDQPPVTRHSGYFARTEKGCFLVPSEEYGMLSEIDVLKIIPASDAADVSLDGFKTGDRIWVDIMTIDELDPPAAAVYGAVFIESGDGTAVSRIEEIGYAIIE